MFALRETESGKYIRVMTLFGLKAITDTEIGVPIVFDTFVEALAATEQLYFAWSCFNVGNTYFDSMDIIELVEKRAVEIRPVDVHPIIAVK